MADLPNPPEPDRRMRRDHGIRRVSTATRWTVAAAAAGSAALGLAYADLVPSASGTAAPAQGTPPTSAACTQQPAPATTATTPTRSDKERDDGEDEKRAVPAAAPVPSPASPQNTVTCTPLTPPAQAPAPTQQAPQTRTGAS